jgi:glycosyltransferase involved in cell wall biosynthesis
MINRHYVIFHHSFNKIAGTERVVYNLLELFATYPNSRITLLLAGKQGELALRLDHLPVDIVYLDVNIEPGNPIKLILSHTALYKSLFKYINSWCVKSYHICLATNPFLAILMKLATSRSKFKAAVVACEHFSLSASGALSLIARKLFYKYLYVVTLTQKDKDLIAEKYTPLNCVCIPNASPFEIIPYNTFKHQKTILSIGRLTGQKGFDLLIRSYALIADRYPDWNLIIIGDDYGDKKLLEELISKLRLKKSISIIPATKLITTYYKSACFYVLSSRFEGLPMVLIEAMSFGLPLIAFNCPTGPAELVNTENGILVENGDIEKLAEAMAAIIDSPALLAAKAVGAQKHAANFSKDKINRLWNSFLSSIV